MGLGGGIGGVGGMVWSLGGCLVQGVCSPGGT